jgi:hypothetical protein
MTVLFAFPKGELLMGDQSSDSLQGSSGVRFPAGWQAWYFLRRNADNQTVAESPIAYLN